MDYKFCAEPMGFMVRNKMGELYHHALNINEPQFVWEIEECVPFNELILSWNAKRPIQGYILISVALKHQNQWSEWLPYACWGNKIQKGNTLQDAKKIICIDQDIVKSTQMATGFRIRLEGTEGTDVNDVRHLYAYVGDLQKSQRIYIESPKSSLMLDLQPISQMSLQHPRNKSMCSPVSTTAVLQYLKGAHLDPLDFAQHAYDQAHDIYGNWILNIAEASYRLGNKWRCWVQRMNGFNDAYQYLSQKTPLVVSVKGPLKGAALPYEQGHLLVIRGFDANTQRVLCMDPAFENHQQCLTSYDLQDFMLAWSRRSCLAYCFTPN